MATNEYMYTRSEWRAIEFGHGLKSRGLISADRNRCILPVDILQTPCRPTIDILGPDVTSRILISAECPFLLSEQHPDLAPTLRCPMRCCAISPSITASTCNLSSLHTGKEYSESNMSHITSRLGLFLMTNNLG